jgi:hypothetical protein
MVTAKQGPKLSKSRRERLGRGVFENTRLDDIYTVKSKDHEFP